MPKMRLFTPEIAWHETLPIYSCDLQPQTSSPSKWCTPFADLTEVTVTQGTSASPPPGRWTRLATAGGDTVVRLWRVQLDWTMQSSVASLSLTNGAPTKSTAKKRSESHAHLSEHLTYLASLKRHEKPVNVVRWSPSGLYLASAGDDLFIVLWCNQTEQPPVERTEAMGTCKDDDNDDEAAVALETWVPCRSLRRHLEDIYDLCWSPDSQSLISGSVDHSVIVWQLDLVPSARAPSPTEGPVDKSIPQKTDATQPLPPTPSTGSGNTKCLILRDHKHYVQGVTWDPLGFYIASLSGDRACRIYRAGSKNCLAHVSKCGKQRLFQDDSWKSFFRRLTFSPDGLLLACPSGNLEDAAFASTMSSLDACVEPEAQPIPVVAPQHAAHVFLRSNFSRPAVSFPTGNRPVVTVRFCPQPFQLRITGSVTDESSSTRKLFDLPYRWLFCLVLEDGILFCDTQQSSPFAQVSQMHYQALNDATWSDDGHTLVTCSTDGYCSVIRFTHGELGIPYRGPIGPVSKEAKDLCDKTPSVLDDPSTKGQLYGDLDKSHHESSPQKDTDVPQVTSKTTTEDAVNNEIHSKKRRVTLKTLSTTINDSVKTTTAAQPDKTTSHEPVESKSHEPALRKRRVSFVTLTSDTTAQSASCVQLVDTGGSPSKESQE